jgi:hypothetical protein
MTSCYPICKTRLSFVTKIQEIDPKWKFWSNGLACWCQKKGWNEGPYVTNGIQIQKRQWANLELQCYVFLNPFRLNWFFFVCVKCSAQEFLLKNLYGLQSLEMFWRITILQDSYETMEVLCIKDALIILACANTFWKNVDRWHPNRPAKTSGMMYQRNEADHFYRFELYNITYYAIWEIIHRWLLRNLINHCIAFCPHSPELFLLEPNIFWWVRD